MFYIAATDNVRERVSGDQSSGGSRSPCRQTVVITAVKLDSDGEYGVVDRRERIGSRARLMSKPHFGSIVLADTSFLISTFDSSQELFPFRQNTHLATQLFSAVVSGLRLRVGRYLRTTTSADSQTGFTVGKLSYSDDQVRPRPTDTDPDP